MIPLAAASGGTLPGSSYWFWGRAHGFVGRGIPGDPAREFPPGSASDSPLRARFV